MIISNLCMRKIRANIYGLLLFLSVITLVILDYHFLYKNIRKL